MGTKPLSNKTYELDKLMHMFLPIFKQHSYQDVVRSVDPNLDLMVEARAKITQNPERYDMTELHTDPWYQTVLNLSKKAYAEYSVPLMNSLETLSQDSNLTDGQRLVFQQIYDQEAPVSTIKGQAGSGKSYATAELIKNLLAYQANTLVLAPTHVAVTNINQLVDEVRQERFDQDLDVNRLQKKKDNHITIATLTSWQYRNAKVIEDLIKYGHINTTIDDYDVILVDEAFATDGASLVNVFIYAFALNIPVILIGDPHQLPAIANQPKDLLKALTDNHVIANTTTLSQVMRTKEQTIVGMATAVMAGDMGQLANYYTKPDMSNTTPAQLLTPTDFESTYWLEEYLAANFVNQTKTDPFAGIILVPTNKVRHSLNNLVQNLLVSTNRLDPNKSITLPDGQILYEGDVIMVSETQNVVDMLTNPNPKKSQRVRLRGATRIQLLSLDPTTANGVKYNKVKLTKLRFNTKRFYVEIYAPDLDRRLIVNLFDLSSSGYNPGMYSPDVHELWHDLNIGYAATVNKVQGLSIDHVQTYLDATYPHLTRNLVYSAVTRARESIRLIADPRVLEAALKKTSD